MIREERMTNARAPIKSLHDDVGEVILADTPS